MFTGLRVIRVTNKVIITVIIYNPVKVLTTVLS